MSLRMLKVGVGPSASRNLRAHADSSPSGSPYCGVMNWLQVGKFLVVVEERIEIGGIVRRQRELLGRIVLHRRGRGERQRVGALVEGRDRDAVAEHVVDPAQRHRLRRDLEARCDSTRRSWPSRGRSMMRCSPNATGRVVAIYGLVVEWSGAASSNNHRNFGTI